MPCAAESPTIQFLTLDSSWLDKIEQLSAQSFSRPWTREMITAEFLKPGARVYGLVEDRNLLAFCLAMQAADELEVYELAVEKTRRRQGLGGRLLSQLLAASGETGVTRVYLEVRESNHAAQALYRRFGFVKVGSRDGYYVDNAENALLFQLYLKDSSFDQKGQMS